MPPVRLEGIGTGLPPNLIKKIIESERQPIKNIEARKKKSQSRLDLVRNLEEKLDATKKNASSLLSERGGFRDLKLDSSDSNIVSGTIDESVDAKGSVRIEVIKLPRRASVLTNSFKDKDNTEIGIGYFRFRTAEGKKTVYIDGKNNTLEKVADQINASNVGIKARVVEDRSDLKYPYRLMLSGISTGLENQVEYPELYFLGGDQDIFFERKTEAKNGIVKIEGFEMEISDNVLREVLPGVILTLRQAAPGKIVHIEVKEDVVEISNKFKKFIETMNEIFSFIQSQNKMDEKTDTSSTLGGDSLLQSIESRLRRLVQDKQMGVNGKITRLTELGVIFNREGQLDFDDKVFKKILTNDSFSLTRFLFGDGFNVGFLPSLNREMRALTNQVFGPVYLRRKNIEDKIDRMNQRIEDKERWVARKEVNLRRQFSNLESTMARLRSQSGVLQSLGGGGGLSNLLNFSGAQVS